jgi:SAM-dependent methyltransferase
MSIPKNRPPLSRRAKAHYFDALPAVPSKPRTVFLHAGEVNVELQADRGVFGSRGVDLGTLQLLKEAPKPPEAGDILDLGAGYGPIAIALARQAPQAKIWAVDVNERALELTRVNAESAKTPNITASLPDEVPPDLRFAAIYSNPPVRVGKAPLHELLQRWLPPARRRRQSLPRRAKKPWLGLARRVVEDAGLRRQAAQVEEGLSDPRGQSGQQPIGRPNPRPYTQTPNSLGHTSPGNRGPEDLHPAAQ